MGDEFNCHSRATKNWEIASEECSVHSRVAKSGVIAAERCFVALPGDQ